MVRAKQGGLRPGEVKIMNALLKDEKSWTQLKEEVNLSNPVLADYLKRLQKKGIISKSEKKYYIRRALGKLQDSDFKKTLQIIMQLNLIAGTFIKNLEDKKKAQSILTSLLKSNFGNMDLFIFKTLGDIVFDQNPLFRDTDTKIVYQNVQQAIENWINPWLHTLSLLCVANRDLSENAIKTCIKDISEIANESFTDFAKGWPRENPLKEIK